MTTTCQLSFSNVSFYLVDNAHSKMKHHSTSRCIKIDEDNLHGCLSAALSLRINPTSINSTSFWHLCLKLFSLRRVLILHSKYSSLLLCYCAPL